ncbi:MAG: N-acetylmuramic acid 6-phosphate etherase, partial [Deinococcota bacterium]
MTTPPSSPLFDPRRTEGVHPAHADLDRLDPLALVQVLADDQRAAVEAVRAAAPALARAVEAAL